ncbi:filamentous hemagglutinin N-terminal domain-containing protein [Serratia oryzae]|uniref:two-partner secretion domain-containing protein n=1 Tax=Serratia oryzae TaxID=2034155 RepID=UPI0018CD4A73|nr:filamentous hemagglutinin N-terminal domain-containing protein [Serratia oryzae]
MSKIISSIGNTSLNRLTLAILGSLAFSSCYAADLPASGVVKFGSGAISQPTNQQMQINQSSDKLAIEWQSFNIAEGNKVNFQQPSSNSIALNRVVGTEGSKVMGQLNANGRVFLVNPNGVLFGSNAQVNVGGLVASTQDLTTTNFSLGKYNFSGGNSPASVVNQGTITAKDGGAVVLLGGQVSNQGNIQANLGSVKLAAGKATTLDFGGDGLVNIQVTGAAANALAENSGFIQADGGQVVMSAAYANSNVLQTVVNNTGTIQAQTLSNRSGKIVLSGGQQGLVNVDGILDASTDQGNGGNIETSGQSVNVSASASVDTRGFGGQTGTWTVAADKLNVNDSTSSNKVSARAVTNSLRTSNVELISNSSDLTLANDISWSTANQLLLAAQDNIVLNANLKATGKNAGVAFIEGGDYVLAKGKSVTLSGQGASFSNNGQSYTVIQNVAQLQAMENDLAGYYVLGNTIDASSTAQGEGFRPIGSYESSSFNGVLSGLGNTINQLNIRSFNRPDQVYVGLFSALFGEVRNLGLIDTKVSTNDFAGGDGQIMVGALAGLTGSYFMRSRIHDVYAENVNINTLSDRGWGWTGGLFGLIGNADINNVSVTGTVTSSSGRVGGLVGLAYGSMAPSNEPPLSSYINNSYATVTVNGSGDYVGGLIGMIGEGAVSIRNSYATGDVTGTGWATGGLIGYANNSFYKTIISDIYATGNVSGNNGVGGLIGESSWKVISNAHASGSVQGTKNVGGLIGNAIGSELSDVYATGNVTGNAGSISVGGLTGVLSRSDLKNAYATGNVTGGSSVGGLTGTSFVSTITNSKAYGTVKGDKDIGTLIGGLDFLDLGNGWHSLPSPGEKSVITNSYGYGTVNGKACTGQSYCGL